MAAGPEHADVDSASERARQRRAVPPQALRWVEEALDGATILSVAAQPGGSSAAMHRVTIAGSQGEGFEVMLRRYLQPDAPARHEAAALEHMGPSPLPTPELLGVDADGVDAGVPAVLMSVLDGRPRWDSKRRRSWAHELAEIAASIHDHGPAAPTGIRAFETYAQVSYEPPRWADDPTIWERAVDVFHQEVPDGRAFIHRDFHPGNLLWSRSQLTGVVDWEAACIGPPSIDVAHCRVNFLYETPDLASDLADAWLDVTGSPFEPWADIATIIGLLDSFRSHPPNPAARRRIERTLARALAECGA